MHKQRFWPAFVLTAIFFSVIIPAGSFAAGLTIQSGASVSLNGGSIDLGCTDLGVSGNLSLGTGQLAADNVNLSGGSLDLGSGQVTLAGDWANNGVLSASSGDVSVLDGCAKTISTISGDNQFYSFTANSSSGKRLEISAGSNQVFNNSLNLQGIAGQLLLIRSTVSGSQAFFTLPAGAAQSITYVDVQDNNALGGEVLAPGAPIASNSVNSGNALNWFNRPFAHIPIPTLSLPALLLLMATILFLAYFRMPVFKRNFR